jgi:hypothetical protein
VLHRFRHDEDAKVRGVLTDLVDSGMVFKTGRGTRTTYRAARLDEYERSEQESGEGAANLMWVAVNRFGPATETELGEAVPLDAGRLNAALERLVHDGRAKRIERDGRILYSSEQCVIPFGAPAGWEAAVFDHYQAMVTAITTKMRRGTQAVADETVGGSTYGFVIWKGHPLEHEVLQLLSRFRREASALRSKLSEHNAEHSAPDQEIRVITYLGQTVIENEALEEQS